MKSKIQWIYFLSFAVFFATLAWRSYDFVKNQKTNQALLQIQSQMTGVTDSIALEIKNASSQLLQVFTYQESQNSTHLPTQSAYDLVMSLTSPDLKTMQVRWVKTKESLDKIYDAELIAKIQKHVQTNLQKNLVLDFFQANPDELYQILVSPVQIKNGPTSELSFVVGVHQKQIFQSILSRQKGAIADVAVVNQSGIAVGHITQEYVGKTLLNEPIVNEIVKSSNAAGSGEYFNSRGQLSLGSYEKITGTNVNVVVTAAADKFMQGYLIFFLQIGMLGIGIMIAGMVLIHVFTSDMLMDLIKLQNQVRSLLIKDKERDKNEEYLSRQIQSAPVKSAEPQQDKLSHYQQLAASFTHVVKGPLTNILANAQLARSKTQNPEVSGYCENIENEARQTREMLAKLSVFSGAQKSEMQKHKIDSLLKLALKGIDIQLAPKGVQFIKNIQFEDEVFMNLDQLSIALKSIFQNSLESLERVFTKEIRLSIVSKGSEVEITIADTGEGMSLDQQKKAMDPFYTTRSSEGHIGLGLSAAMGIIKDHNGTMKIQSEPGKGTTIVIMMPIESLPKIESAPKLTSTALANKKVENNILPNMPPTPDVFADADSKTQVIQNSYIDLPPDDFVVSDNKNSFFKVRKPKRKNEVESPRY